MKRSRIIMLVLFALTVTPIAIYNNWSNFLMGGRATTFNLAVSSVYMFAWFIFSLIWGVKKERAYQKFIKIYWGTHFVYFIIAAISTNVASLLLPLMLWYGGPMYGINYFTNSTIVIFSTIALLGPLVSASGYWIGLKISKTSKPVRM